MQSQRRLTLPRRPLMLQRVQRQHASFNALDGLSSHADQQLL